MENRNNTRPRPADLLPNEREISFENVHRFFSRNKAWIAALCVAVILSTVGYIAWQWQAVRLRWEADVRLAAAESVESLRLVAQDYAGTDAALVASFALGDYYFQQKQWDQAVKHYQDILDHHPSSVLVPSAWIGLGAINEATEKPAEAIQKYQYVTSNFPDSFQAAQAQFALARLQEAGMQLPEAKKSYENFIARYPRSSMKKEASDRLQKVNLLLRKKSAGMAK